MRKKSKLAKERGYDRLRAGLGARLKGRDVCDAIVTGEGGHATLSSASRRRVRWGQEAEWTSVVFVRNRGGRKKREISWEGWGKWCWGGGRWGARKVNKG